MGEQRRREEGVMSRRGDDSVSTAEDCFSWVFLGFFSIFFLSPTPLRCRTAKNRDVSTGPFARPLDRSLAPLTHSLRSAQLASASRAPHALIRSLALSLAPELMG